MFYKVLRAVAAAVMAFGTLGVVSSVSAGNDCDPKAPGGYCCDNASSGPNGYCCDDATSGANGDPCCDLGANGAQGGDPCCYYPGSGPEAVIYPECGAMVGSVRGTAFEDKNENGKRDAGEQTMAGAWWKVSNGGSWFVCGFTGADATYAVPVTEIGMTYFVYAIAPLGWRTTTPMVKTKTVNTSNGFAYLFNDLGFVRDAGATTVEACNQYSPKRVTPPSILMTANSTGTFNTLVAAAIAAGLANTLNNDGALTVFAPTDAAFAKLPAGTVEALLKDPVALGNILKYHVIGDKVPASQVVKATELTTLQGGKLKVSLAGGGVMINNAKVLATDIMASNGIVHVIDTVLLP